MHAIYANALCNISATGAVDGRDGCFFDRSPFLAQPLIIKIALETFHNKTYFCVDQQMWATNIDDLPLSRRAWVVQERFLSRRVLHFGRQQLLWECGENHSCETFPNHLPALMLKSYKQGFRGVNPEVDGAQSRQKRGCLPDPELNIYGIWNLVVEAYTRADLTMENDKFVAIMGLAQYVQTLLKTEYFAGLWRKYFIHQLFWRPGENTYKPNAYIAPSWSWALWAGPIHSPCRITNLDGTKELIQILDVKVETLTNSPLSQVIAGSLQKRGSLLRCKVWYTEEIEFNDVLMRSIHFDVFGEELDIDDYEPSPDTEDAEGVVYALPVLRRYGVRGLLQLTRQGVRQFERFGTFSIRSEPRQPQNTPRRIRPLSDADGMGSDDVWLDGFKLDKENVRYHDNYMNLH